MTELGPKKEPGFLLSHGLTSADLLKAEEATSIKTRHSVSVVIPLSTEMKI